MSEAKKHSWSDDPRVLAYLLGEADEHERSAIEEALANGDAGCRAALDELEPFVGDVRRALAVPEGEREGIEAAARREIVLTAEVAGMRSEARPIFTPRVVRYAAALAAGLLAVGLLSYPFLRAEWSAFGRPDGSMAARLEYGLESPRRSAPRSAESALMSMGYIGHDIGEPHDMGGLDEEAPEPRPESPEVLVSREPLSTFALDVDTASYTHVRRCIQAGIWPEPAQVRTEELLNYFRYGDTPPAPDAEHPFTVQVETGAAPWRKGRQLVRIGMAGESPSFQERVGANLVFLVDVSGSMDRPDKLPLVVDSLGLLTETLLPTDRVAVVVYANAQGVALESTPVAARESILQALEQLSAGGRTHGSAGIELAYEVAADHFVEGGINRVILCTDGDFNVGATSEEALEDLISAKAAAGIELSVLGFGGSFRGDARMEALSNRGNGTYAIIDSFSEATRVFVTEVGGTLMTIAKDVKLQVEWNPAAVRAYRLIGYENRALANEDFRRDEVDAGEMGAGHSVVALYEVDPATTWQPGDFLGTVRLRYKRPGEDRATELETPIPDGPAAFDSGAEDLRFTAAVAAYAQLLKGSAYAGDATYEAVRRWALESLGNDAGGQRAAFVRLVELTLELDSKDRDSDD